MPKEPIKIEYGAGLSALERVLKGVTQPGSFHAAGRLDLAPPRLVIEGVGQLSFPVPPSQAKEIVAAAALAPYGRGEETILDTSVRKVWQVSPEAVKVGGKVWDAAFASILTGAKKGLGCEKIEVSADLYKLLVYDQGGFFLSHRDTEKAPGMFGTLVVSLPSAHEGGDLVIRHAGTEEVLSLCSDEPSELVWAAFYADCEHEVKPVTSGYRVCLVYNLIQARKTGAVLAAPDLSGPVKDAAKLIRAAFDSPSAPVKLAWLLEHQYSPAELAFNTLKNVDAARASVLLSAAEPARCEVHLGIVHIEESGAAEPNFDSWSRGRSYRGRYTYDDDDDEDEGDDADYEVACVCDGDQFIDTWCAPDGTRPGYGAVPLGEGELLPSGALDKEKPDKSRVTEATGNEGASYERSYHRAVIVLWPSESITEVLMQAGAEAVVPHLQKEVQALGKSSHDPKNRKVLIDLARRMVEQWPAGGDWRHWRNGNADQRKESRAQMLRTLNKLGDGNLIASFLQQVLEKRYDGTENEAICESLPLTPAANAAASIDALVRSRFQGSPLAIVSLLTLLSKQSSSFPEKAGTAVASALCEALPKATPPLNPYAFSASKSRHSTSSEWDLEHRFTPALLAELLTALEKITGSSEMVRIVTVILSHPSLFDPLLMLAPALEILGGDHRSKEKTAPWLSILWEQCAQALLARSANPPSLPADWSQPMNLACNCVDCKELQIFAHDPFERVHRFRVRQDRRQHLHEKIEAHSLDMTHETERKGSPQTLVCTKTRVKFDLRRSEYQADLKAMAALAEMANDDFRAKNATTLKKLQSVLHHFG